MIGIVEHQDRSFEANTMFSLVDSVLSFIPSKLQGLLCNYVYAYTLTPLASCCNANS